MHFFVLINWCHKYSNTFLVLSPFFSTFWQIFYTLFVRFLWVDQTWFLAKYQIKNFGSTSGMKYLKKEFLVEPFSPNLNNWTDSLLIFLNFGLIINTNCYFLGVLLFQIDVYRQIVYLQSDYWDIKFSLSNHEIYSCYITVGFYQYIFFPG